MEPGTVVGGRAGQRRGVRAVLAASARCGSLEEWLDTTLEGLDRHLGFRRSSIMLVLGERAFAGASRGHEPDTLTEYFERWADCDPLAAEPAIRMFDELGYASTATVYPQLDSARRRFVDEFLDAIGVADQLSLRLPGNAATTGYLTVHEATVIGEDERVTLAALASQLAEHLRLYLPRGLPATLSLREEQSAELVALGFGNREVAAILNIGEDTVKKHLYRAMKKLGLHSRTQLAVAWTTGRVLALPASQPANRP